MPLVRPDHPAIVHRGWCDRRNPSSSALVWAGTGIALRFEGKSLAARLSGRGMLEVVLDGRLSLLRPELGEGPVAIADDLPEGPHTVELRKRSEPVAGTVRFEGFELEGSPLPSPPESGPFLLFLGDSLTCGYGNLATHPASPFAAETEDVFRSYAGIASAELSATFQASAWSGKGLATNFDRTTTATTRDLWRLADPNDPSSRIDDPPRPDVVLVNLGTNDVFHVDPDWTTLVRVATALGQELRETFPAVPILLLDGPALTDQALLDPSGRPRPLLSRVRTVMDEARDHLAAGGPCWRFSLSSCVPDEPHGADHHPGLERHHRNGLELAAFLRALPRWGSTP